MLISILFQNLSFSNFKNNIKNKFNKKNIFITLFLIFMFIILYFIRHNLLEPFTQNNPTTQNNPKPQITQITQGQEWSQDLTARFLKYQDTMSKNDYKYNLEMLKQQVTPGEVEEYLKTGYWNWDEDLKNMYLDKVSSSTLVNIMPEYSLDYAMKKYTPSAANQLLAWNYKEGKFLLYGGKSVNKNNVKCSGDPEPILQEIINGEAINIKNEDIPNIMSGFSFVNNSCNPCVALKNPMDKTCAFKLNVEGNNDISPIWAKIWNI